MGDFELEKRIVEHVHSSTGTALNKFPKEYITALLKTTKRKRIIATLKGKGAEDVFYQYLKAMHQEKIVYMVRRGQMEYQTEAIIEEKPVIIKVISSNGLRFEHKYSSEFEIIKYKEYIKSRINFS